MIKNILIVSFILRIVIALLGEHGDVINYMWWSKDLLARGLQDFYDRSIANAMPPTYPPVTSYIFWLTAYLHEIIWKVVWLINIKVSVFPSNLVFWLESEKGWYFVNKLPSIIADLGIGTYIYKLVSSIKGKREAIISMLLFLFNPVFWYNSSLWGQTDSIFAFFLIASFYYLHKKRKYVSVAFFLLSILTKPTSFFVAPIYLIFWLKNTTLKQLMKCATFVFLLTLVLYYPFHPDNTLFWISDFYLNSLGGELDYIVANSFNFWGLVFGFDNVSARTLFLGLPASTLGYLAFFISSLVLLRFWKQKIFNVKIMLMLSALIAFSAFLFLPMMHERYFYPVLLLLTPTAALYRQERVSYYMLSLIHLLNLYHFWWVPRIEFLVVLFSNRVVEMLLILFNFALFYWYVKRFKNAYV
jgi:Gpi18-like mannosyltransferase